MANNSLFDFDEIQSGTTDVSEHEARQSLEKALKQELIANRSLEDVLSDAGIDIQEIPVAELQGSFQRQRELKDAHEESFSRTVSDLYRRVEALGLEFDELETLPPEVKELETKAKQRRQLAQDEVTRLESAYEVAKNALNDANNLPSWKFLVKGGAVKAAQESRDKTLLSLDRAKAALVEADRYIREDLQIDLRAKREEILAKADIEIAQQGINALYTRLINRLKNDKDELGQAIKRRNLVLQVSQEKLREVVNNYDQAKTDFGTSEALVRDLTRQLEAGDIARDSDEYRQLKLDLDVANAKLADAKGRRDTAVGIRNEIEEKLQVLQAQRDSYLASLANIERSLGVSQVASRALDELMKTRLELQRQMASLESHELASRVSRREALAAQQQAAAFEAAIETSRARADAEHAPLKRAMNVVEQMREAARKAIAAVDEANRIERENGYNTVISNGDDKTEAPKPAEGEGNKPQAKPKPTDDAFTLDDV